MGEAAEAISTGRCAQRTTLARCDVCLLSQAQPTNTSTACDLAKKLGLRPFGDFCKSRLHTIKREHEAHGNSSPDGKDAGRFLDFA